ncbi:MAG: PAS domain S-box protein [Verrucomicrobiota bacterium]
MSLRSAMLDFLAEAVAAANRNGEVMEANAAWLALAHELPWLGRPGGQAEAGEPVFEATAFGLACGEAAAILAEVEAVFLGARTHCEAEFAVLQGGRLRWLNLRGRTLREGIAVVELRDVSARCKAQQDLRESHTLFQRIMDSTGDGIFIYDKEGRFLMHNAACADHFGVRADQIAGRSIEEVFPPHLVATIRGQNELVLRTGRTLGYEIVFDSPLGSHTLLVQKGLYRNHRDETVGIIGISRDITERKQTELKIERSERHFRALIEKSTDCIVILSGTGIILYASPAANRITGYGAGELIATDVFFWVHPDGVASAKKHFEELLEMPGASITAEYRTLCKNEEWKWVEVTASNLLQDASVQAIVLNIRDVSERKEAEQASRRFEAIIESSIDGILSLSLEGKIMSWNPAARRIFGYSEDEALGRGFDFLIARNHLAAAARFCAAIQRGKAVKEFETVCTGSRGVRIEVALTLSPIYGRNHRVTGSAVIVRDITDRRRLEKEVLEIADFEKHRIGQDLHDDLCQHLVGIAMSMSLLHGELACLGLRQAQDARQIAEMIRTAVDHARTLARGLSPLDMAHGGLMAGLETLVANTEKMFRMPCTFECPAAVHVADMEAATHLFRIAQEALHNAVKHSKGTRVGVRLERTSKSVQISVSDDGVGLSDPKKHPSGGGMGMHTMYYRARIIGASVKIQSNPQGGTCVVCRLPESQERSDLHCESADSLPGKAKNPGKRKKNG